MFHSVVSSYGFDTGLTWYVNILIIVLGLVIGSFLNVVGLRLLSGESIVLPPSKCPHCNTKLKWYDNIPVLAYILLLGKCRYCKKHISIQYPLVELITAVMFFLIFLKFGFTMATPLLWILVSSGIVMCITDLKEQIIFDAVSLPMIPIGLIYSFCNLGKAEDINNIQIFNTGFSLPETFISSLTGIVGAFLFFEIISLISKLIMKQRAFGEGDTIIAMIFAAWFGWKITAITVICAFILQVLVTLPLMFIKLLKLKDKVAILSFSSLIISAIIPLILTYIFNIAAGIVGIFLILAIFVIAVFSALIFLRRVRELNAYTLLPFGPALIVSVFLTLFFYEQLLNLFYF